MNILITRVQPKADQLAKTMKAKGDDVCVFPFFEISAPEHDADLLSLNNLKGHEVLIFVSYFAVDACVKRNIHIPESCTIYAVGAGTAFYFKQNYPSHAVVYPKFADSEHLLELIDASAIQNKPVLILRGDSGREHLYQSLSQITTVKYVTCYKRTMLSDGFDAVIDAWQANPFDVVVVTSTKALEHLIILMSQHMNLLQQTKVSVMGDRMKMLAKQHDLQTIDAQNFIQT